MHRLITYTVSFLLCVVVCGIYTPSIHAQTVVSSSQIDSFNGEQWPAVGTFVTGALCTNTSTNCYYEGNDVRHRVHFTGLTTGTSYVASLSAQHVCGAFTAYENFNTFTGVGMSSLVVGAPTVSGSDLVYLATFTANTSTPTLDFNAKIGFDASQCTGNITAQATGLNNKKTTLQASKIVNTTPSPIPTNTPTLTSTPTPSFTPTNTPTATPTHTPTQTLTPTETPTPTFTPTNTPTITQIPTESPTPTPTSTTTPTLTLTPTFTPTPIYTPTETPTSTPTLTLTPTSTPTPTITPSTSPTPSDMPSTTPSATPTPTLTPTFTLTPTPRCFDGEGENLSELPLCTDLTPTVTFTPTPTQVVETSPTFTPTPSTSPIPTSSPQSTPTPTPLDPNRDGVTMSLSCIDKNATGRITIKQGGNAIKDVKVKFTYKSSTQDQRTNDIGQASATFTFESEEQIKAEPEGYPAIQMLVRESECTFSPTTTSTPTPTSAPQAFTPAGEVQGVTDEILSPTPTDIPAPTFTITASPTLTPVGQVLGENTTSCGTCDTFWYLVLSTLASIVITAFITKRKWMPLVVAIITFIIYLILAPACAQRSWGIFGASSGDILCRYFPHILVLLAYLARYLTVKVKSLIASDDEDDTKEEKMTETKTKK